MTENYDWWELIPNASLMLRSISDSLVEQRQSVVLLLNEELPWYEDMHEKIYTMIDEPDKQTKVVECPESVPPGKFLLDGFFRKETRDSFRLNIGYEKFISENDSSSPIKDCFIIVKIKSSSQLSEWVNFVSGYDKEKRSQKARTRCLFILEYFQKGDEKIRKIPDGILTVKWQNAIQDHDRYMYAMLSVSRENVGREIKEYLAEFITIASRGSSIELIAKLARQGVECVKDPETVLKKINNEYSMSNGSNFDISTDSRRISNMLWQAQIKVLYCKIEEFRNELISKCERFFSNNFSFVKQYGKESMVLSDYHELEIGDILYLQAKNNLGLDTETTQKAKLYKSCRDKLAHFSAVDYEMVTRILE